MHIITDGNFLLCFLGKDDTSYECNSSAIENGLLLDESDSIDCLYSCSQNCHMCVCTCYSAKDNWSFGKNQLTRVFKDTTDILN